MVKNELLKTENITIESLKSITDRTRQLSELEEQAQNLSDNSYILTKNAIKGQKQRQNRRYIMIAGLCAGVIFVIYIIFAMFCGIKLSSC